MNGELAAIEDKINGVIAEFGMLPEGCAVAAGLSGGADSMALTHFLHFRRHAPVTALHVNHCLRGAESEEDELFVRKWCGENGIPIRVLRADIKDIAAQRGQGLEECGREVRYRFFTEAAGSCKIATAHTLSDLAETVLLRLASGTGAKGLCGIPPVRGSIIRPFLRLTRSEVEAYCRFYRLPFRQDSSNTDRVYARNRVRMDLIPVLCELNPAFEQGIWRLTRSLREDASFLEEEALRALRTAETPRGYRAEILRELPQPVLARALAAAAARAGAGRLEYVHITSAERTLREGGCTDLPGGIQFRTRGNTLFVGPPQKAEPLWQMAFTPFECVLPDGRVFVLRKIHKKELEFPFNFHNLLFHNCIRYDTISNDMSLRNRREGDTFRPAGRGITKTLKKLFQEEGIPQEDRRSRVLFTSREEILWIEGIGAAESAMVTEDTEWIAEINIRGAEDVK